MGTISTKPKLDNNDLIAPNKPIKYVGKTKDGKKHGSGKLYDDNGDLVYDGVWKNDYFCGKGKLYATKANGETYNYEGDFYNGEKHGSGIETDKNGEQHYKGDFKNGFYDGKGVLYEPIMARYNTMVNGKMD